ncbi:MAG: SDR family oxidoreductase [Solirubrobacterales bacterium]|nr:SDR family oxidoreductase [Solirubrobacterales bacterium]
MEIDGRVAVITGGGGGIGGAIAQLLAAGGAKVVLADLDGGAATAVADSINGQAPGSAIAAEADVTDSAALKTLIAAAEDAFGPVDMFFANAGIGGGGGIASEDEWAAALGVNLMAHIRAARLLVPGWLERGQGYFVSTASAAGLLTQIGLAPYAVTKHAAVGFAEWMAVTYGARGIRVSCLCPMGVDTNLLNSGLEIEGDQGVGAKVVADAGRILSPEEAAEAVLEAIAAERFLILPHPEVLDFYRFKGSDYDRWIGGMQRLQARIEAS